MRGRRNLLDSRLCVCLPWMSRSLMAGRRSRRKRPPMVNLARPVGWPEGRSSNTRALSALRSAPTLWWERCVGGHDAAQGVTLAGPFAGLDTPFFPGLL